MVCWQGREAAIYPVTKERNISMREVEGDREVVRRDVCRTDQVDALWIGSPELGTLPELPAVVHVAGIIGLPIRPEQVGSQMECPGGGVSADTPIRQGGYFGRRPSMHHPLCVPI